MASVGSVFDVPTFYSGGGGGPSPKPPNPNPPRRSEIFPEELATWSPGQQINTLSPPQRPTEPSAQGGASNDDCPVRRMSADWDAFFTEHMAVGQTFVNRVTGEVVVDFGSILGDTWAEEPSLMPALPHPSTHPFLVNYFANPSNIYSLGLTATQSALNAMFMNQLTNIVAGGGYVRPSAASAQWVRQLPGESLPRLIRGSGGASAFDSVYRTGNATMHQMRHLPYVAVAIDVGWGMVINTINDVPTTRIATDAVVDLAITGSSVAVSVGAASAVAAMFAGGTKGAAAGTALMPILGSIAGAIAGSFVGLGLFALTDYYAPGGYTMREYAQNALYEQLFGDD